MINDAIYLGETLNNQMPMIQICCLAAEIDCKLGVLIERANSPSYVAKDD
jgi:hypothetical protein